MPVSAGPISRALGLGPQEVVSLIGGGGKTTLLFSLARELETVGPVLVTTTTKIDLPRHGVVLVAANYPEVERQITSYAGRKGWVVLGREIKEGKLLGVPPAWLEALREHFPYILVEADGSRGRPLKAHAPHEPVLPPTSSLVVILAGASALGKPFSAEYVHRPQIMARITGLEPGGSIQPWLVARAWQEMGARAAGAAPRARLVFFLNQVDTGEERKKNLSWLKRLGPWGQERALVGCLKPRANLIPWAAFSPPPLAAVVLAAGASRRLGGRNKLLLPWQGKTVIRQVVENTLAAVPEVIVVTGYQAERVEEALRGLPVKIIRNPNYTGGQAASLQRGLEAVDPASRGAMFVLGDQPLVPPALLKTLALAFIIEEPLALYPRYRGQRGNPVLFARPTFPALAQTTGDRGGRQLLERLGEGARGIET
ncbi:MAG TPA: putative selenium-dependent hydroxylase accessory protein YqeC, partial [Firmicutes bacterium]|nr:putative selenium-dependent hydroxylase accessory protein YqeC [Bacillota bacterium]